MSEMIISRDEAIAWKRDKCTVKFMEVLDDNCKMIMMNWGKKAYNESEKLNSEMLGQLYAFRTLLDAFNAGNVIPTMSVEKT